MTTNTQTHRLALPVPATPDLARRLTEIWEDPPGIAGFLGTVDHKKIGIRYLVTAFVFLLDRRPRGADDAAPAGRTRPALLTPEQYNQLFSMHGDDDDLPLCRPVLSGFQQLLLAVDARRRDMAFPRLNALSYWIFLAAGMFLYVELPAGCGAKRRLVQLRAVRQSDLQSRARTSISMRWA